MVMPALALALPLAAVIARLLKAVAEARRCCRTTCCWRASRASRELRLVLQEALRNAVGPTLALTGVQFTFLIGGTVIVERIFAYPGIGNMAIDAVINRDLPLIQGLVLLFGTDLHPASISGLISRWRRSIRACGMPEPATWNTGHQPDDFAASRRRSRRRSCAAAARSQGRVRRRLHPVPDHPRACSRRWSRRRIRWRKTCCPRHCRRLALPSAEPGFLLGTDGLGRDVLSRVIFGARISLTVAFVAAGLACLIGSLLGLARRLLSAAGVDARDLAAGRYLDGLPAGAALDPAGRRARRRPALGDRRHRGDRLDALLPRRPHRNHGPGADGLCGGGAHHRLLAPGDPVPRDSAQRRCRC